MTSKELKEKVVWRCVNKNLYWEVDNVVNFPVLTQDCDITVVEIMFNTILVIAESNQVFWLITEDNYTENDIIKILELMVEEEIITPKDVIINILTEEIEALQEKVRGLESKLEGYANAESNNDGR